MSQKKKDVLNSSFNYTPCITTYTEQFVLFEDIKEDAGNDADSDTSNTSSCSKESAKQIEEVTTESEYEFSDVDEEETMIVNKCLAKAGNKLRRNRQTKQYIHITTTY